MAKKLRKRAHTIRIRKKTKRKLFCEEENEEPDPMFDEEEIAMGAGEKAADGNS